jgi:hypothetical protein
MGLLVVSIVAAFSAVAASSASAVVFTLSTLPCTEGTNVALCWQESAAKPECNPALKATLCELIGEQSETVSGGLLSLTVLGSPNIVIECTASTGKGTIVQLEPLVAGKHTTIVGGVILYEGCKITSTEELAKKCKVPAERETKPIKGELQTQTELLLEPATGTVFIEIPFENNGTETCPTAVKGARNVTGKQLVTILNPEIHELTKTGETVVESELELFSDKADLKQPLTLSFTGLEDLVDISKTA